jgi:hypothetical protein
MRTLAIWSVRHRRRVVVFWLLALVAATLAARVAGSAYSNSFSLPNQSSGAVMNVLSIGAAFGILAAVFEKGWLGGRLRRLAGQTGSLAWPARPERRGEGPAR